MSIPFYHLQTWTSHNRDIQQDPPYFHCAECGAELYRMDDCVLLEGRILCPECAEDEEGSADIKDTCDGMSRYFRDIYGSQY